MEFILDDYKKKLIKKFDYDEDFAEDIAIMADSLINYFGDEYSGLIYDALLSCKICIAPSNRTVTLRDNINSILESEELIDKFSEEDLQNNSLGLLSSPEITFEDGVFKVTGINKIIILPSHFNSSNPDSLGILAKECIKLIKSELNTYTIEDNTLITKSGILTRKESLKSTKTKIKRKCIEEKGTSLKHGLDSYDQLCLIRTEYNNDYDVHGNDYSRIVAGFLLDYLNLKSEIRKAEILHNDSDLREVFTSTLKKPLEDFLKMTDELTHLEHARKQSLTGSDEDVLKARNKLDFYFSTTVATTMRSLGLEENELSPKSL